MGRRLAVALSIVAGLGLVAYITVRKPAPVATVAADGTPIAMTSGKGVVINLSDHPIPVPAIALRDPENNLVSLDGTKGKVVLLNFWATWCGPCREEIPTLIALQQRYAKQVQVIGISIDTRPAGEVQDFAEQLNINYPIAMSTDAVEQAFGGVSSIPATFVVSKDGQIVDRHIGSLNPQTTEHEIRSLSGLSTDAVTKVVKDTGQVLLTNAAYATEMPGVDFTGLTPTQKEAALKRLNTEHCTCGCNLTVAQCRINDDTCDVSGPLAKKIIEEVKKTVK